MCVCVRVCCVCVCVSKPSRLQVRNVVTANTAWRRYGVLDSLEHPFSPHKSLGVLGASRFRS